MRQKLEHLKRAYGVALLWARGLGEIFISALFGIALALIFQKVCKDKKCIVISAPATEEITSKVYQFEGECFKYKPYGISCPEDEKNVVNGGV